MHQHTCDVVWYTIFIVYIIFLSKIMIGFNKLYNNDIENFKNSKANTQSE